MKTTVSPKGQIVLPAEIRPQDRIETGQKFEVQRLKRGEYRLVRRTGGPGRGLVDWLLDANVLSEPTKASPHAGVIDWLRHFEGDLVVDLDQPSHGPIHAASRRARQSLAVRTCTPSPCRASQAIAGTAASF